MSEVWKDIGVEHLRGLYSVNEYGDVIRTSAQRGTVIGKRLKPQENKKKYLCVRLTDGKVTKNFSLHRLVAKTFIPNPENLPQVNHIDGNKKNNHYSNLEWCTNEHNLKHAHANGLMKAAFKGKFGPDHNKSIPIIAINITTGERKNFMGINECARQLKTNSAAIYRVRNGEYSHTKGWRFEL